MIEKATHESLPLRFLAGDLHPDHDTIAHVRQMFLPEVKDLCVQILLLAQAADVLKLGHISLDGTRPSCCGKGTSDKAVLPGSFEGK